ncbi:MAG: hypothetical protein ACU0B7_03410 [Paracoccaceae bacterium]
METLNIEKFSPKEAELRTLADNCQSIDIKDLKTVRDCRISLKNARVEITKTGKAMRDDATKFSRAVIAREKELIAIIEPEEQRLQKIEAEAKLQAERAERAAILPTRKERLAAIGDGIEASDDELLDMDGPTFEGYVNKRLADKNEADRLEIERVRAEQEKEAQRIAADENARQREEQARKDERERIEREQKAEAERKEREAAEEIRRKEQEAADAAAAEAELQRKLEVDARYQAWLNEIGYNEGEFYLSHSVMGHIVAYKLVSTFKK